MRFIKQPNDELRSGDWLKEQLTNSAYNYLQVAVAFVKLSGVSRIETALREYLAAGNTTRFVVGIDHNGTSEDGLRRLLDIIGDKGEVWVVHNPDPHDTPTFHPKIFLFEGADSAEVLIGSNNLTKGGLFTNYEAALAITLTQDEQEQDELWTNIRDSFDQWCQKTDISQRLDESVLSQLLREGLVKSEAQERRDQALMTSRSSESQDDDELSQQGAEPVFRGVPVPSAPKPARIIPGENTEPAEFDEESQPIEVEGDVSFPSSPWFGITILDGDLPQKGSSNEIRITKFIRNQNPNFWLWNNGFIHDSTTGQYTRDIQVCFNNNVISAYLKDFPSRKPDGTKSSGDFRIGSIAPIVQALSQEDDLIIFEQSNAADYDVTVVSKTDPRYDDLTDGFVQHTKAKSTSTGTYKKFRYG